VEAVDGGDGLHFEARVGQIVGQHASKRLIVLDYQDSLFHGA